MSTALTAEYSPSSKLSSEKKKCPLNSPANFASSSTIFFLTSECPVAQVITCPPNLLTKSCTFILIFTLAITLLSGYSSNTSRAKIINKWSLETTLPLLSIKRTLSLSPSSAMPRSHPYSFTMSIN